MKQRFLSILTTLALCLTLLPTAALAEGTLQGSGTEDDPWQLSSRAFFSDKTSDPTPTGPYTKNGDYYLAAGHYMLTADLSDISINIRGDVTLDLNGKKLQGSASAATLAVGKGSDSGHLTLKDNSEDGTGTVTGSSSVISVNKGSLTLESGTVSCTESSGNYAIGATSGTTVTLKGGTVTATGNARAISMYGNSTLCADGGTVDGLVRNKESTITHSDDVTTATTFDGTVKNGGTIAWGTFNGDVENGYIDDDDGYLSGTISGGTFNGTVTNLANSSTTYGTLNNLSTITNNGLFVFQTGYTVDGTDITASANAEAASAFISGLNRSGTGYAQVGSNGSTAAYFTNTGTALNTPTLGEGDVLTLSSSSNASGSGYAWNASSKTLTLTDAYIPGTLTLPATDGNVTIKTVGTVYVETIASLGSASNDLILDDADLTVGNISWNHSSSTTNGVVLHRSKLTVTGEDGIYAGDITIDALSVLDLKGAKLSTNDSSNFNNLKNYLQGYLPENSYEFKTDGSSSPSPTYYVYSGTSNVLTLTLAKGPQIDFTVTMPGNATSYPSNIELEVFSDNTLTTSAGHFSGSVTNPSVGINNGTLTAPEFLSNYDEIVALFANSDDGIYVRLKTPTGWTSGQVYYITYSNGSTSSTPSTDDGTGGGGSSGPGEVIPTSSEAIPSVVSIMALTTDTLLTPTATMLFTADSVGAPTGTGSSTPSGLLVYKATLSTDGSDTYTISDLVSDSTMAFTLTYTGGSGGPTGGGGSSGSTWYTITASAGAGGSISPSGAVSVRRGNDKTFTVSPAQGYVLSDLLVDGQSVGALTTYTFENVKTSHTIKAVFTTDPANQTDPDRPVGLNCTDHVAYVQGYADGTVRPNAPVTRAQVAVILYRLLTPERLAEIETDVHSFTDVTAADWFSHEVATMANGGYISGYADGRFGGNDPITRAQFVTILTRFLSQRDVDCDFTDVPASHWAYNAIATAVDAGWIAGYADGSFRPDQPVTRAQVMAIINRALDRGVNADSQLLGVRSFADNPVTAWHYYEVLEAANSHDYTGHRPSENWTALR